MNRRKFIAASALASTASLVQAAGKRRLGLTIWSYNIRWKKRAKDAAQPGWHDALDVLDHCHDLGAGCLQIGVRNWTKDFAGKVRDRRESLEIELEGQIGLPWKASDTNRFEREIRAAKEAGATILRTTCLGGRRYETFDSLEKWKDFSAKSYGALERAEPIARKEGVKLAVENHKDWRIEEQQLLLEHLGSEHIGMTFDFGNNFSLLEHPHDVAEALAPYIMSTHVKDMALAEYEDGFLLSEVPLGTGVLNIQRMMDICLNANPSIRFNLEMITRDPLRVPVLQDSYWTTMRELPARELASTLHLARSGKAAELPGIAGLDDAEQLAFEEQNVRQSFDFAGTELDLDP